MPPLLELDAGEASDGVSSVALFGVVLAGAPSAVLGVVVVAVDEAGALHDAASPSTSTPSEVVPAQAEVTAPALAALPVMVPVL